MKPTVEAGSPTPDGARKLPCFPCPHGSACCRYGVSLSDAEKDAVVAEHGASAATWSVEEQGWRTAVVDGRCFFLRDNTCSIHRAAYYPDVCRRFPFDYAHDRTICPEFAPEG